MLMETIAVCKVAVSAILSTVPKPSPASPMLWLTNGAKNKGELTMFSMFKVISIRSHEIRTVYAVDHCARFLIFKDGEWSWNDSKYYIPLEVAG